MKIQNVIAIDQENYQLVMTINGGDEITLFDVKSLPSGGGIVVGDGNCWAPSNGRSKSQFLSQDELDSLIAELTDSGYRAITVANKMARSIQFQYGLEQAKAVIGLGKYARNQVNLHGSFDSGHEVRQFRGDISYGQRKIVTDDFLMVQNSGGYESPWMDDAISIAFDALDKDDRPLFDIKKTMLKVNSPRRLAAIAVAVYDPWTGKLREYHGKPWGMGFIIRHVIGLNGVMRGTGEKAPGNPMRAALRCVGRRYGDKVNAPERAHFDKLCRDLIRAFQKHGDIRPVSTEA